MTQETALDAVIRDLSEESPALASLVGFDLNQADKPKVLFGVPAWKSEQLRELLIRLASKPFAGRFSNQERALVLLSHGRFRETKLVWVAEFSNQDGFFKDDNAQATQRFFANVHERLLQQLHPWAPKPDAENQDGVADTSLNEIALSLLAVDLPVKARARLRILRQRLQKAGLAEEFNVFPIAKDGGFQKPWLTLQNQRTNLASNLADFSQTLQQNDVNALSATKERSSPDLLEARLFNSRHDLDQIDLYLFSQGGTSHALYLENAKAFDAETIPTLAALIDPKSEAFSLTESISPPSPWRGLRRNAWWMVILLSALVAFVLSFTPGPFDITAKAVVRPAESQSVTLPFASRLLEMRVEVGEPVKKGQILAVLDAQDIRDQQDQSTLEHILQEVERRSLEGSDDILGYQVAELKTEIALQRRSFFDRQAQKTNVVAPKDGIIADKASPELLGSMMMQGERLYELQTSTDYSVQLTLRPQDLRYVVPNLSGSLVLQGDRELERSIKITHQPRVYSLNESGEREFLADASVDVSDETGIQLQKGLLGLARIRIEDERPRYWLWSREIRHFVNLKLWQFFGWRWSVTNEDG